LTLYIGVDGGGTHTRAVVVDRAGRELGRAEGGGSVVRVDAPAQAARAVIDTVRSAAEVAGAELPAATLWAGLAGAGSREARVTVEHELAGAGLARDVIVGTDVEAAFQDAFGDGPGVLLIAGTGSIAWARDAEGQTERVGGWGERLGDEGSGFSIGLEALRSVARAEDGRGEATRLQAVVLEELGLSEPGELVAWTATASKAQVAGLVPVVAAAAGRGDAVAAHIMDRAVAELTEHLTAVVGRGGSGGSAPDLVLWGGLLQPGGSLRVAMERAVTPLPLRLVTRDVDPALGAATLARKTRS
jgi:N-acetylglucosamine kinase-like BadF-type ATPase